MRQVLRLVDEKHVEWKADAALHELPEQVGVVHQRLLLLVLARCPRHAVHLCPVLTVVVLVEHAAQVNVANARQVLHEENAVAALEVVEQSVVRPRAARHANAAPVRKLVELLADQHLPRLDAELAVAQRVERLEIRQVVRLEAEAGHGARAGLVGRSLGERDVADAIRPSPVRQLLVENVEERGRLAGAGRPEHDVRIEAHANLPLPSPYARPCFATASASAASTSVWPVFATTPTARSSQISMQ